MKGRHRLLVGRRAVTLLVRTTRRLSLTQAGELLLTRARRILGELDALRYDLVEAGPAVRGRVAIGFTQVLGPFDLPGALAQFSAGFPNVSLLLRSELVAELLDALDNGDLDLVMGPVHDGLDPRFSAQPMVEDSLVVITPPQHRLARAPRLTLADLADEPFVSLGPDSGLRDLLNQTGAVAGIQPRGS